MKYGEIWRVWFKANAKTTSLWRGSSYHPHQAQTACCSGSTVVQQAACWHQHRKNSAHLLPRSENSSVHAAEEKLSLLLLNATLQHIWWSWCTCTIPPALACVHYCKSLWIKVSSNVLQRSHSAALTTVFCAITAQLNQIKDSFLWV